MRGNKHLCHPLFAYVPSEQQRQLRMLSVSHEKYVHNGWSVPLPFRSSAWESGQPPEIPCDLPQSRLHVLRIVPAIRKDKHIQQISSLSLPVSNESSFSLRSFSARQQKNRKPGRHNSLFFITPGCLSQRVSHNGRSFEGDGFPTSRQGV